MKKRNEEARGLFIRSGNAGTAVAFNARPRRVASAKTYVRKPKHRGAERGGE